MAVAEWFRDVLGFDLDDARGVVVVQPLETQPYGMVDFSVRSPEGHVLMFGSAAV